MHFPTEFIVEQIRNHGMLYVFFLAVFEGPIVSVVAGWLVRLGYLQFAWVYAACVAADLIGDGIFYCIGSCGSRNFPRRWFPGVFARAEKLSAILDQFHTHGGRILVVAKWTHSLGFAALIAAGAARMSIPVFFWYNFLATLPKTLFFVLVGYALGHAYTAIDTWLWRGSVVLFVVVCVAVFFWGRNLIGRRA